MKTIPNESNLLKSETPFADRVIFKAIDESSIMKAAVKTKCTAGSSG